MKPMLKLATLSLSAALLSGLAGAQTFTISAGFAPNAFGSPSYAGWQDNFIQAIQTGADAAGDQSLPTGYQNVVGGTFDARLNVATGFPSWKGQANPTGAFANELGNRFTFGANIVSAAQTFTLSQLSDGTESSIADDQGFDNDLLSYAGTTFGQYRIGTFYGADGVKGTADDVVYDASNPGTDATLINEISLISFGVANDTSGAPANATDQEKIDFAGREYGNYTLNGIYRLDLGGNTGTVQSGGVKLQAVPEPASMAALGFGALALLKRRKKAAK